jgi:tetratricopeptide (TPR) repeat protein
MAAGLAAAAAWSILAGWADYWARKRTLAGSERAIAFTPGQAAYYYQFAALASDTDPKGALTALERAVALNPFDSRSWIELGLRVEMEDRAGAAERYLLRAAEVDKGYLPRWSLANYYLRRGDEAKFWFWSKAAASMIYDDPAPLFRLCGRIAEDGNLIDRLEIRRPDLQSAYISYLLSLGRVELIGPSARRLLEQGRPKDVPLLLSACDRLIAAKSVDDALAIWNGLARTRRIPFQALAPDAGSIFANDDFTPPPVSQGFDWHVPTVGGISVSREDRPRGCASAFPAGSRRVASRCSGWFRCGRGPRTSSRFLTALPELLRKPV